MYAVFVFLISVSLIYSVHEEHCLLDSPYHQVPPHTPLQSLSISVVRCYRITHYLSSLCCTTLPMPLSTLCLLIVMPPFPPYPSLPTHPPQSLPFGNCSPFLGSVSTIFYFTWMLHRKGSVGLMRVLCHRGLGAGSARNQGCAHSSHRLAPPTSGARRARGAVSASHQGCARSSRLPAPPTSSACCSRSSRWPAPPTSLPGTCPSSCAITCCREGSFLPDAARRSPVPPSHTSLPAKTSSR